MPSGPVPAALLVMPHTAERAETLIGKVVAWAGIGFRPERPAASYLDASGNPLLERREAAAMDAGLREARLLLGPKADDVAYRAAVFYLDTREPDWRAPSGPRPATQRPARWWLVERVAPQPTSVAYEADNGLWYEWDPNTRLLHDTPWLFVDYYFRYLRSEQEGLRFVPLTAHQASEWIARGIGDWNDASLLRGRRGDRYALDPNDLLPRLIRPAGG